MYGQLIDGILRFAPKKAEYNGAIIFNAPDEVYEALGYYPIEYTEEPDDAPDGYVYVGGWEQTEDAIVQTWHLEEYDSTESDYATAGRILMGVDE